MTSGPLHVGVTLRRGSFALDASFTLSARWTVLFGPSGAGKSTLLRTLSGLLAPDTALIKLGGKVLCNTDTGVKMRPGSGVVGFAMQEPSLFPHMSVARNVGFGIDGMKREERESRIEETLALMEASHLSDRMPAHLSGGERQRVSLARTLVRQPQILLLDEPFSALDAALKETIFSRLKDWLVEREVLTLYVSHDIAEVFHAGAEVVLMEAGRVLAQGPAEKVLAKHRSQLLRRLLAARETAPE